MLNNQNKYSGLNISFVGKDVTDPCGSFSLRFSRDRSFVDNFIFLVIFSDRLQFALELFIQVGYKTVI